jgi:hypothetical protein
MFSVVTPAVLVLAVLERRVPAVGCERERVQVLFTVFAEVHFREWVRP